MGKSSATQDGKKYCYRYTEGNDYKGKAIVILEMRVIIRETDKTFWHVWDMPNMSLEQLIAYRTGGGKERQKHHVKKCLKGAARSRFHYTKEEAIKAFVYRKQHQLSRMQLKAETIRLCLEGLKKAGFMNKPPQGEVFTASDTVGEIASNYCWDAY